MAAAWTGRGTGAVMPEVVPVLIVAVLLGWLLGGILAYFGIASRQRARRREADRNDSAANLPVTQPPLDAERSQ